MSEVLSKFSCDHIPEGDSCGLVVMLVEQNAKLRELCKAWSKFAYELFDEFIGEPEMDDEFMELDDRMRELGVDA